MRRSLFALVLVMAFVSSGWAVELPATEKLLPEDVVMMVNINDFSDVQAQFKKTKMYGLYTDEAMAEFIDSVRKSLAEELGEDLGSDVVDDILSGKFVPTGRVAIAGLVSGDFSEEPTEEDFSVILISQWGENTGKVVEMIEESAAGRMVRKSDSYRGVDTKWFIREASEKEGEEGEVEGSDGPRQFGYAVIDDCIVVVLNKDIEMMQSVIARIKGSDKGSVLAGNEKYTKAMKAVGPYHDIDIYMSLEAAVGAMESGFNSTAGDEVPADMFGKLGVKGLKSLAMSVGVSRKADSGCIVKGLVGTDSERTGLLKAFEFGTESMKVPGFVGSDAIAYNQVNLDFNKAYNEIVNMMFSIQPMMGMMLNSPLTPVGDEENPPITLQKDIISHLGSHVIQVTYPIKSVDNPSAGVVAFAVKDRAALEKSVSVLYDTYIARGNTELVRDVAGTKVYTIDLGAMMTGQPGGESMALGIAFTDNYLMYGMADSVGAAIRLAADSEAETLASVAWFKAMAEKLPSKAGFFDVRNQSMAAESMWKLIKGEGESASPIQVQFDAEFDEMFDFDLLPEFDAVKKYFGTSVSQGTMTDDGFAFEINYFDNTAK